MTEENYNSRVRAYYELRKRLSQHSRTERIAQLSPVAQRIHKEYEIAAKKLART